jgi:transglutaminase-like putative cysteine protease
MVTPPVARVLRAVVTPLVLIVLIALSGVVAGRIYAGPLLAQLVAGAALGSVAVAAATRRLPSWTAAPLSVLLLGGYAVLAVRLAAERAGLTEPLGMLLSGAVVNGIPRLLTAMIPVEAIPDTVLIPVVAAWLTGLAGAEVAVRAGRVLLGCAPAAVLYGGALYLIGPNADTAGWPTLTFAALVAVALAVGGRAASASADRLPAAVRTRALIGSGIGVVVVLALIALVGPWVGGRVSATPVDPRTYVQPPQVDSLDESPLNRISGWALGQAQRLLTVSGAPDQKQGDRLRLAVLPDYDGVTWRVGATYRNAGRVLPSAPVPPGGRVEQVTREITIGDLSGRLLPVVPTPTEVQGARVAYDPVTGTLIRPEGLQPGLRYTVTSTRQIPDLNLLPAADVPSGADVARFLTVGEGTPEPMQKLAEQLADDNGAPYDRAVAIEQFLGEHYRKVADAPSGHAYPNLSFFLFGPRNQGGQRGTSEQFAASFALLGRLIGLPTRVVVGFQAPAGGGPVTGADAYAWPEVLFDELGWVAFDPLPQDDQQPRPVEEDFKPLPEKTPPTSEPPPPSDPPATSAAAPAPAAAPPAEADGAVVTSVVAGSVLLLGVLAVLVVLQLRRAQRRTRLSGSPADRIAGAWLEFTDALRLAGHPAPPHLAASEVAVHAVLRPALPPVDVLVEGVNTSAFAPAAGPGSDRAEHDQATRAAEQAVAYAQALRSGRSWWRRAWWSIHPGPLRWHRRR